MKIINSPFEVKQLTKKLKKDNSIGFIPTMGALHQGHISLIEKSLAENDITFVSIYLNETQFNNQSDLTHYPSDLQTDLAILRNLNVDFVFTPNFKSMYPDQYTYRTTESQMSKLMCGAHRPGHFDGVLTVVMKLFNIVSPTRAYFGQKDYQQLELIKGMVAAYFLDVEIVSCPTVRESDGLAMSSRNQRLSKNQRAVAGEFNRALVEASSAKDLKVKLANFDMDLEYFEKLGNRKCAAVQLGNVRLIDNV